MSTRDHEGRINLDSEGSSNLKKLVALLMEKLSDEDFSEFMQKFGGNLVAMVADDPVPGGKKFGQDAKFRTLIREADARTVTAFKESIGDDRTMRVLNGQIGNA